MKQGMVLSFKFSEILELKNRPLWYNDGRERAEGITRREDCMDISYLLFLQDLRERHGDFFLTFFQKMTYWGELSTVLLVIAGIYWCVSKRYGTVLLLGFHMNRLMNGFLKITACVYRPWIRDPRVVPDEKALQTATGYSFPSGHSTNAGVIFGSAVVDKQFSKGFRVIMLVCAALVGFSRNYLGVHTPQDVIVGLGVSIILMAVALKLAQAIEKHPSWDVGVALTLLALSILLAVYAFMKSYPEDFDETGKLIVDGFKMANDTLKAVGYTAGFSIGWILERRFVRFSTDVDMKVRFGRLVSGFIGFYIINLILNAVISALLPKPVATTLNCALIMFYIVFLWPLLFSKIEGSGSETEVEA